ncbi:MAG: amidase [Gammaproteobacteria bacterium]|nr:amidase [Gammaproteobacteria bacterium]
MELTALSACDALAVIMRGEVSTRELVSASLARVEAVNTELNAVVTLAAERALTEAETLDARRARREHIGVLQGLPVVIKDNQRTEGIPTTLGSPLHEHDVPAADAGIVARIRAAGGIVIGKTNIPEFSIGANTVNRLFGATGNPFAPERTCGGSSGGSAVAVSAGMVPLATGSDHGGSLRIPASYCGVVGYRASPGVVPNEERTTTHTHYSLQGPIARTVSDAALLLSVIAERTGTSRDDPMAFPLDAKKFRKLDEIDLGTLRVGVSADLGGVLVSEQVRGLFEDRIRRISALVAGCDPAPADLIDAPEVDWHLRQDVFVSQYSDRVQDWDDEVNPNVLATYNSALATPMASIARARRRQIELFRNFAALFDRFDVVLVPGVSVLPFPWKYANPQEIDGRPVENYMAWLALTASLTVVGHPVVALPCGLDYLGTPFGIQVVGPMYGDHRLLSIANALEQAFASDEVMARPIPEL